MMVSENVLHHISTDDHIQGNNDEVTTPIYFDMFGVDSCNCDVSCQIW